MIQDRSPVSAIARPSRIVASLARLRRAPPTALFGLAVMLVYAGLAIFSPLVAPFGEAEVVSARPFGPWDAVHLLGTDQLGRDVFSRLVYGARNSIGIAFVTTLLAFVVGGGLGILAAVTRGGLDLALTAIADTLMAIPQLIFALILLAILGSSIPDIIAIVALLNATQVFRLARSAALGVAVLDFVEAARLRGETGARIVVAEILPNILPTLVAEFGLRFCFVFLTISALSFLGLGIQPPSADWGTMVREGATFIGYGNGTPLVPAAAIALLTVAVNFVVDWFLDETSGLNDGR